MYSPSIIERAIDDYSKRLQFTPRPRLIEECRHISSKLTIKLESAGWDPDGKSRVSWQPDERDFMRSETILCACDFRYFADRYAYAELDASEGGGINPVTFWPSQERTLELIAQREELNEHNFRKYGFSDGILIAWHKTRQQGATALARLLCLHRMIFRRNTRSIAASIDETKIMELYTRDKVILDNLPFFLKPEIEYDVKADSLAFEKLKSRITYQMASQKAGVGTGQQFDVSHMTEVALWPKIIRPDGVMSDTGERLIFDFAPAVPQARTTFVGFESTANGKSGFWYEFTENIRKKESGFEKWIYSFTPWYINHNKNRSIPPDGWEPDAVTREHADLIESTSIEFAGKTVRPSNSQLYWWQSEYRNHRKMGALHLFLSNYPATPEQSFQFASSTALPVETIERMRARSSWQKAMPYTPVWAQ